MVNLNQLFSVIEKSHDLKPNHFTEIKDSSVALWTDQYKNWRMYCGKQSLYPYSMMSQDHGFVKKCIGKAIVYKLGHCLNAWFFFSVYRTCTKEAIWCLVVKYLLCDFRDLMSIWIWFWMMLRKSIWKHKTEKHLVRVLFYVTC